MTDSKRPGGQHTVVDSVTYYLDLEHASQQQRNVRPRFVEEYRQREEFGMADLSSASWLGLVERMAKDVHLFKKFFWYVVGKSGISL